MSATRGARDRAHAKWRCPRPGVGWAEGEGMIEGTARPSRRRARARAVLVLLVASAALPGCASLGLGAAREDAIVRPGAPPDYDFLVARELEAQGDLAGASEALQRAIAKDPGAPVLHRELAETLARQGRYPEAVAAGELAFSLDGSDPRTRLFLGTMYRLGKQPEKAEAVLRAADGVPIGEDAALLLYGILIEAERYAEALNVGRWIAEQDEGSLRGTFAVAGALERLGRHEEAEQTLRDALKRDPGNLAIYGALARSHRDRDDREGEIRIHREALRARPGHAGTLAALADALVALDRTTEARRTLEDLERAHPADMRATLRLAFLDYEAKRFPEAARRFERVLAASPEQAEIAFFLGITRRRLGDDQGARAAFEQVPEGSERWIEARLQLAGLQEKRGDLAGALAEIEALRAKQPSRELDLFAASLRAKSGDLDGAVAFLQGLLAASPEDEEVLYQIGVLYGEAKRDEESMAWMQRVLAVSPDNPNALNWIGYSLAERGERLDEAEAMIRRALLARPDDGFITDSLGWVHYMRARALKQSGRSAEANEELRRAIEQLERAVELTDGDPVISEHLGDAWLLRGDRARALKHYEDSLAQEPRPSEQPDLPAKLERLRRETGQP